MGVSLVKDRDSDENIHFTEEFPSLDRNRYKRLENYFSNSLISVIVYQS